MQRRLAFLRDRALHSTFIEKEISGKITEIAVRDTIHGREVRNTDALANPQALALFRALPELAIQ